MREPTHGHGLSSAMLRLLREMDDRERRGWRLTPGWRWAKGSDREAASGVRHATVIALLHRGMVTYTPSRSFYHPALYRLTRPKGR